MPLLALFGLLALGVALALRIGENGAVRGFLSATRRAAPRRAI